MNEGNGKIIGLNERVPRSVFTRDQRKEIDRLIHDAVIQECAKVHEYYLTQIPTFTAKMIQDALMSFGLIQLQAGSKEELEAVQRQMATTDAPVAPLGNEGTGSVPCADDARGVDVEAAIEGRVIIIPDGGTEVRLTPADIQDGGNEARAIEPDPAA